MVSVLSQLNHSSDEGRGRGADKQKLSSQLWLCFNRLLAAACYQPPGGGRSLSKVESREH